MKKIDLGYNKGRFCIAFVYTPTKNFIVTGEMKNCTQYIEKNTSKSLVHFTTSTGSSWIFLGKLKAYWFGRKFGKNRRTLFCLSFRDNRNNWHSEKIIVRKIPQKWIPEYDSIFQEPTEEEKKVDAWTNLKKKFSAL